MMEKEDRKAWERRQRETRIVDIAQEVFFKNGFDNTTIIEIAKAAGYSKRAIYLYFKDKEEIFLAVVLRGLTLLNEMLEKAYKDPGEDRNGLQAMGTAYYNFSLEHPEFLQLIMIYESDTCIYYKERKPDFTGQFFKEECQKKTDAMAETITRAIQRELDAGTIKTTLTPTQLMLILWGQVVGVMQIILMRKQHFEDAFGIDYRSLFVAFQDMLENGMFHREPPSPGD